MAASAKAVFEADLGKLDAALLKIQGSMLRLQKGAVLIQKMGFSMDKLKSMTPSEQYRALPLTAPAGA